MKRKQLNELRNSTEYLKHFYHKKISISVINNQEKTIKEKTEGTIFDLCDLVDWFDEMNDEQLKKYDIHIEMIEESLDN